MIRRTILLSALMLLTLPIVAQNVWVKIASEGNNPTGVTVTTTVANVTYRFGTNVGTTTTGVNCATAGCWTSATTSAPWTKFGVYHTNFPFANPAPGLKQELDVAEGPSIQVFSINNAGTPQTVSVPALPTTCTSTGFTPGQNYTLTESNITLVPNGPLASLLTTFPLPPEQFYLAVVENLTMTTTLNGIPFSCTSPVSTTGTVTLTCVAQSPLGAKRAKKSITNKK